jgi:hypothetical protein
MSDSQQKESDSQRVTGRSLQFLARALESPLSKKLLYTTATRRMGITVLHELDIPPEAVPYLPRHLGQAPPGAGGDGGGEP